MTNKLYIGFSKDIELPKGSFLFIDDEVPVHPKAKIFDPLTHSFNPLRDMDYRKATTFVETIDSVFSRGDSTLTKDTGLDFIAEALDGNPKSLETLIEPPDKKSTPGHVWAYSKIRRIVRSPVLRRVLCSGDGFSFKGPNKKVLARINRAELGDFDARVLCYLLIAQFKGQVILPNLDFYGLDMLTPLVRDGRLIAGVRSLKTVERKAPELHDELLLIEDKHASGTTYKDAQTLALSERLTPDTNAFNDFVTNAMG